MTQKIAINGYYGGFALSDAAMNEYKQRKEINDPYLIEDDISRDDPVLISILEELGEDSWGGHAKLKIVEIPDDVDWVIEEYDGIEWVAEAHRIWN